MQSDKSSAAAVTNEIARDPALASKILKAANSAYYGFSKQISNLHRAVALLGFTMVRSLALSMGVLNCLPVGSRASGFSPEGLWSHSLAVAMAMRELGERLKLGDEKGYHFTVGLLHDIGQIVLDQFFSSSYEDALQEAGGTDEIELHDVERRIFGFDHGEVGAMLLSRWRFPEAIHRPIAVHHQRETTEGKLAPHADMLRVANAISSEVGLGEEGYPRPPETLSGDLELLKVKEDDLIEITALLERSRTEIKSFYGAIQ